MSNLLADLAPHFFQVAYVVRDIAAAESWFGATLGVHPFTRLENVPMAEGCEYRGGPADSAAHLSLGYLKDTQLELIENVRGESLYSEFLSKKGPGLHHVAFMVPDYETTVAELQRGGLEILARGAVGPGSQFAYFDCEGPGFSVIEILGFDDAMRAFMEQLRQKSLAERGP